MTEVFLAGRAGSEVCNLYRCCLRICYLGDCSLAIPRDSGKLAHPSHASGAGVPSSLTFGLRSCDILVLLCMTDKDGPLPLAKRKKKPQRIQETALGL